MNLNLYDQGKVTGTAHDQYIAVYLAIFLCLFQVDEKMYYQNLRAYMAATLSWKVELKKAGCF